jgi:hypothetical protein
MKNKLNIPEIVAITGFAQTGKDTFFLLAHESLGKQDTKTVRGAFADGVKGDLHQLLVKRAGISAYTNDPKEKEMIRPILVAYGTGLMRKLDPQYWIRRMERSIELGKRVDAKVFITDLRYPNELEWLRSKGGKLIHITKTGSKPANSEERKADPILKEKADVLVEWEHVGKDKLKSLKRKVTKALKELSS